MSCCCKYGSLKTASIRVTSVPAEHLRQIGLNATSGWYETFFRGYDASLGRFMQVDPLAAQVHVLSPYNYANNNPATLNDPKGDLVCAECLQEYHQWSFINRRLASLDYGRASFDDWAREFDEYTKSQGGGGGGSPITDENGNVIGLMFTGASAGSFVSFLQLGGGINISFADGLGKNGRDLVTIDLVALLVNNSSKNFSNERFQKIAGAIERQIESSFSGKDRGLQWVTNATVGTSAAQLNGYNDPYKFIIVDDVSKLGKTLSTGSVAFTEPGGNITDMNAMGHNFSRTGAHEFGHALGLGDFGEVGDDNSYIDIRSGKMTTYSSSDYPTNLMRQTLGENSSGWTAVEGWQVRKILQGQGLLGPFNK